ncbi:hypothetical protein O2V63_16050 [Modestobacter sp. VKM Ac-2977]|uniref:hypothetical protein n=1 Tax=Modestobacter sp. VKM Ac-2977 TaxID=3004131 RepID=UPI0022AB3781|nr:hypothetical protein [Modestobacter sp. VKM Ac-2977]MCZ2821856.1 hypothetical protein [Modestobacter sp. VKM Ac-2977]
MTTLLDLAPRPSSRSVIPAEEELDLAALLQLFEAGVDGGDAEEDGVDGTTPVHTSLWSSAVALLRWAQGSSRRAASWGAVSGGWQ